MLLSLAVSLAASTWAEFGLLDPVRLSVGGIAVDAEHGHASPVVIDLDKDGSVDLVLGQFEGGKVRVYKGQARGATPSIKAFDFLRAGDDEARVSYG